MLNVSVFFPACVHYSCAGGDVESVLNFLFRLPVSCRMRVVESGFVFCLLCIAHQPGSGNQLKCLLSNMREVLQQCGSRFCSPSCSCSIIVAVAERVDLRHLRRPLAPPPLTLNNERPVSLLILYCGRCGDTLKARSSCSTIASCTRRSTSARRKDWS